MVEGMSEKWFLLDPTDESISGPFTAQEIQSRRAAGVMSPHQLIWGPGLLKWLSVASWSEETVTQIIATSTEAVVEAWHFAHAGKSRGPFRRAQLMQELKVLDSIAEVMVWTKGMKEWAPIFEFHDLLNELGVNKRQFPRVDLEGKAIVKCDGLTLIAPLLSVSEGGLGISLDSGVVSGQIVTIEIQSPAFRQSITGRAECRYAANGVMGFKFTNLTSENKGLIVQYVRHRTTRFELKAS